VSLQVAILKVLSGRPAGRATLEDLKSDLTFFSSIGAEWTDRMRRLAARAPALDIFGQGFVLRDHHGWQLTSAGSELIAMIEAPACPPLHLELETAVVPPVADRLAPAPNVVILDEQRRRRLIESHENLPAQMNG
jgi:hypothetical protein